MNLTEKCIAALIKRGFIAEICSRADIAERIAALASESGEIGFGGSMTVAELGLLSRLKELGVTPLSGSCSDLPAAELYERARRCGVYCASANAVSAEGYIVNIDGRGNRVANMIYGADTVIVVAGVNKLCENLDAALYRAKNVAAPKNCVRLKRNTPCTVTGKCEDCNSPDRICRATVIQTNPSMGQKYYVFIIDEQLGY